MNKTVIVGLVFLCALGTLILVMVRSTVPVLAFHELDSARYEGGNVHINDTQIVEIETLGPLVFFVSPRGHGSSRMRVESRQSVPENFKPGLDVGLHGTFDVETNTFHAYRVTTACPSRYEADKAVEGNRGGAYSDLNRPQAVNSVPNPAPNPAPLAR